jgi:hypothetical protein
LFIINGESERYKEDQYIRCDERLKNKKIVVYYESIKREINRRLIYECRRCDERLIVKTEGSTRLTYTKKSGRNSCAVQDASGGQKKKGYTSRSHRRCSTSKAQKIKKIGTRHVDIKTLIIRGSPAPFAYATLSRIRFFITLDP